MCSRPTSHASPTPRHATASCLQLGMRLYSVVQLQSKFSPVAQ
jgi:hypothetical protein